MTNNDTIDMQRTPVGNEVLVEAPTEEIHFGTPPPPPPSSWYEAETYPQLQPRASRRGTTLVAAAGVVAVALGSGVAGAEYATRDLDNRPVTTVVAPPAAPQAAPQVVPLTAGAIPGTQPREQLAKVAAAVQPSVVSIVVRGPRGGGEGSGVILTSDGTILTNNHVADGGIGGTVSVRFSDGKTAEAEIVGRDEGSDLAVLKAKNVTGLTAATLGDDTKLHVGDTVLAIGSPLGLEGSVSAGIVSALHRPVALGGGSTTGSLGDAIQTDAPINPGNSGGALVDMNGHVIGINTAIATLGTGFGGQTGSIGLGFAIPITHAKVIADQLIRGEQPTQAILGVQAGNAPTGGALVGAVTPGSAAEKAGLKTGDVVTAVGDSLVGDAASLTAAIRARRPGDPVTLTYTRNGAAGTATATLGKATSS